MKRLFYLLIVLFITSCTDSSEKEFTVEGKLIDNANNRNWENYDITARTIIGSSEKEVGYSKITKEGKFKITYYTNDIINGNNLRLVVYPFISTQYKLEYLPHATNWSKIFYVGDSASLVFKTRSNINVVDTLIIEIGDTKLSHTGSNNIYTSNRIKLTNEIISFKYYSTGNPDKFLNYYPTGDPIVDTITLDINP